MFFRGRDFLSQRYFILLSASTIKWQAVAEHPIPLLGKMCTRAKFVPKKKSQRLEKIFWIQFWIHQCVIRMLGRLKRKSGLFVKLSDIWIQSCSTSVVECVLRKEYRPMVL